MTCDLTKLEELMTAIRGYDNPRQAKKEWKQVYKLLEKTELPPPNVTHVVGMRDLAGLAELIQQLRTPPPPPEPSPPDEDAPDMETCRRAMKAFRKRLAATRLDDESRICSRDPLSKSGETRIVAINPPIKWPKKVWKELVRQGRLRYVGSGCYELPED